MDINNPKQQPKTCLEQELIDLSNEKGNQAIQSLPKFKIHDFSIDQKQDVEQKNIKVENKFQYKLLKSQKQNLPCFAFAFNKNGNILSVARTKTIIIYCNGQMNKMMQKLQKDTNDVLCLYLMKQSNSYISGSDYNSIIIWEYDKSQWTVSATLKGHEYSILCISMNKKEDMIISGSCDNTLKFWRKLDNKWSCYQTIYLNDQACSLSLNEQEEKLVSCGDKPFIQVMQMKQDKTWNIVQTIEVAEEGFRLCFLNNQQLIFQPKTKDFIEIYYFDNELRQFKKHKTVQIQSCESCDWFFPIQFIENLKLLTVKHGQFLNIFKVQDIDNIDLIQTIDFENGVLYGNLADDGKYLATWDFKSKQIQIRQLIYLK